MRRIFVVAQVRERAWIIFIGRAHKSQKPVWVCVCVYWCSLIDRKSISQEPETKSVLCPRPEQEEGNEWQNKEQKTITCFVGGAGGWPGRDDGQGVRAAADGRFKDRSVFSGTGWIEKVLLSVVCVFCMNNSDHKKERSETFSAHGSQLLVTITAAAYRFTGTCWTFSAL